MNNKNLKKRKVKKTKQRVKHEIFHKKGNKKLPLLFALDLGIWCLFLALISADSTKS